MCKLHGFTHRAAWQAGAQGPSGGGHDDSPVPRPTAGTLPLAQTPPLLPSHEDWGRPAQAASPAEPLRAHPPPHQHLHPRLHS